MKKKIILSLLLILMFIPIMSVSAAKLYYNDAYHDYYAGDIHLVVNGKELKGLPMQPVIINDYTMVPVREVFEALGSQVIWHDDTCQVEIVDNGVSLFIKIGDRNTVVNNRIVPIEEPQPLPMLIGNSPEVLKSMVPLRFVAEKLGFSVSWEDSTRTVSINDTNQEIIGGKLDENGEVVEEFIMPEEVGALGTVWAESDSSFDYIYIAARYGISPTVSRYTSPERVVFDFADATFPKVEGSVKVGGNCVDTVRYANREGFARLVLDVSCKTQVMVLSSEKGILIRAQKSENTQIVYDGFAKRVYFDKNYTGSGKAVANGYSVTFSNLKLQNQKIKIDDGNIYEIIITNSSKGCTITVDGSNKLTYTAEKGFFKSNTVNVVVPEKNDEAKPVTPNRNDGEMLVVIDAGHGGTDPGAVGYNSSGKAVAYESHINLSISLLVEKKLKAQGVSVILTRSKDSYMSLADRVDMTNNSACDLFVSIHCNAMESADIDGTQVYYHPESEIGTVLAKNIYKYMVDITKLSPKNIQNGSGLYVIRKTDGPAVLVETAFISNESDRNFLLSSDGQEKIAEAITQGIMKTLKNN